MQKLIKQRFLKQILLSIAMLSGVAIVQAASPWMRSEGDSYYWTGVSYSTGNKFWDDKSNLNDADCRNKDWKSYHKFEYGYSYYSTLIAGLSAASVRCGDDSLAGMGDLTLGIRGRLNKYRNGRSWEITAIIPTGYDRNSSSRLGNGRFGLEGGLAWSSRGRAASPSIWYWEGSTSIRLWQGPPAGQFVSSFSIRRRIDNDSGISLRLSSDISLRNESPEEIILENRTRLRDFDKVRLAASWSGRINTHWTYQTSIGHVLWGRNATNNMSVGLNISREWRR